MEINSLSGMIGKTIAKMNPAEKGTDVLVFAMTDGSVYVFHHEQDCCEGVSIEDIAGDMSDLIGAPLLQAEEVTSENDEAQKPGEYSESWTWTFYKFATIKGDVTIRWLGESNGYYGEGVDVCVFQVGEDIPRDFLAPVQAALPN